MSVWLVYYKLFNDTCESQHHQFDFGSMINPATMQTMVNAWAPTRARIIYCDICSLPREKLISPTVKAAVVANVPGNENMWKTCLVKIPIYLTDS